MIRVPLKEVVYGVDTAGKVFPAPIQAGMG